MTITYVTGDATAPIGQGARIIAHICNDNGVWGAGFVMDVSKKWPNTRDLYLRWKRQGTPVPFVLGEAQILMVDNDLWVANMIAQHGTRSAGYWKPLKTDALRMCLRTVAEFAKVIDATIHMPRIGTGLAGGTWEEVQPIIWDELVMQGLIVIVYDLPKERGNDAI